MKIQICWKKGRALSNVIESLRSVKRKGGQEMGWCGIVDDTKSFSSMSAENM